MVDTLKNYTFLPWLRQGIAAEIETVDNLGESGAPTTPQRASVQVSLQVDGAPPISKSPQLLGPGDVIGVNPMAIVKTEPRNWVTDFEANYLPYVEFYKEQTWAWAQLAAEQYYHGSLDWFAFDIDVQRQLQDLPETQFPENGFEARPPAGFLPSQIEFNGMPNVRWWEFEDRRTDFGGIRAGTTDAPLLLLAEFGLIYGNDWTVIPYNLEVGTLADIKGIIVADVFGIQTLIRPAGQGQRMDWQKWSMYNLRSNASADSVDNRLFLPPSAPRQNSIHLRHVVTI